MLGSAFEADDAVQETLVRAWRSFDRFEGRAAVRSWLYRIASNVCFDMLKGRRRRALPMDVSQMGHADGPIDPPTNEIPWLGPVPDARIMSAGADPAEQAELRESVRLAFVAAIQHLPARQRAVLILREVLKWHANEVAELLDTTVVSVNSALQRARATLAERNVTAGSAPQNVDAEQEELLARYVDAFERFDIDSLVALLHEDVDDADAAVPAVDARRRRVPHLAHRPGPRLSRVAARAASRRTAQPAFAQWRVDPNGGYTAWSLHVLTRQTARSPRRTSSSIQSCSRCSTCPSISTPDGITTSTSPRPGDLDEVDEERARVVEADRRAEPARRELQARERLERFLVRMDDRAHVAGDDRRTPARKVLHNGDDPRPETKSPMKSRSSVSGLLEQPQPDLADRRERRHGVREPLQRNLADDRDGRGVHELADALADERRADDDFLLRVHDEPGGSAVVVGVQPCARNIELVVDQVDLAALGARLRLGETDGRDLGICEHDLRDGAAHAGLG